MERFENVEDVRCEEKRGGYDCEVFESHPSKGEGKRVHVDRVVASHPHVLRLADGKDEFSPERGTDCIVSIDDNTGEKKLNCHEWV